MILQHDAKRRRGTVFLAIECVEGCKPISGDKEDGNSLCSKVVTPVRVADQNLNERIGGHIGCARTLLRGDVRNLRPPVKVTFDQINSGELRIAEKILGRVIEPGIEVSLFNAIVDVKKAMRRSRSIKNRYWSPIVT